MDIFRFLEWDSDQQLALEPVQDAPDRLQLPRFRAVCFGFVEMLRLLCASSSSFVS